MSYLFLWCTENLIESLELDGDLTEKLSEDGEGRLGDELLVLYDDTLKSYTTGATNSQSKLKNCCRTAGNLNRIKK